jgi:hypothetical protein
MTGEHVEPLLSISDTDPTMAATRLDASQSTRTAFVPPPWHSQNMDPQIDAGTIAILQDLFLKLETDCASDLQHLTSKYHIWRRAIIRADGLRDGKLAPQHWKGFRNPAIDDVPSNTTLFVGGLKAKVDHPDLVGILFGRFGCVKSVSATRTHDLLLRS